MLTIELFVIVFIVLAAWVQRTQSRTQQNEALRRIETALTEQQALLRRVLEKLELPQSVPSVAEDSAPVANESLTEAAENPAALETTQTIRPNLPATAKSAWLQEPTLPSCNPPRELSRFELIIYLVRA